MPTESNRDWLHRATDELNRAGISEPRLKAEYLLAHHLGIPRLELAFRFDENVPADLSPFLNRLLKYEPLQYVLGECDFHALTLTSDARALIPRPETEELVELAIRWLGDQPAAVVIDVGTGSGCIALALAFALPDLHLLGLDSSAEALELAKENRNRLGLSSERVCFARGQLLQGQARQSADLIIANLPYVPTRNLSLLAPQVRQFEPIQALDGGEGGLDLILPLARQAREVLRIGGVLLLEHDTSHADDLQKHIQAMGYTKVQLLPDAAGLSRFTIAVNNQV